MPATRWTKFYWTNWIGNVSLRRCSIEARGFWMDVLSVAADNDPVGYVDDTGDEFVTLMSRISGITKKDVEKYTAELERRHVFGRDKLGRLYCPRMVRDNKNLQEAINSGRRGGRASRDRRKGIFKPSEGAVEPASNEPSDLEPKTQRL